MIWFAVYLHSSEMFYKEQTICRNLWMTQYGCTQEVSSPHVALIRDGGWSEEIAPCKIR